MKRRDFVKYTGAALVATPFMNFGGTDPAGRLIVLGFDGMDPAVVHRLMSQGQLPNMQKLAEKGVFTMMNTSIPPQSPVAWGSFITGADPGVFGIFDFLHRDPKTYTPIFSESDTIPAGWPIHVGKYKIPLKSSKIILKREGKPFWDYLEDRDISATIFKIPTNFPPSQSSRRTMAGMGTPGLEDGYGFYTLYTSDEQEAQRDISPDHLYYAYLNEDNVMEDGVIDGPVNDLLDSEDGEPVKTSVPFKVYVDPVHKTARIDVQDKQVLLAEGDYSEWVEIKYSLIKNLASVTGMVKFFLLEAGERFRLYISPVHISPRDPAVPICTPSSYSKELAEHCGLFHTISLPADTHAFSKNTFSVENFITQSLSVFDESKRIFRYEMDRFIDGKSRFLFFYFSTLDQGQHMFWSMNDPQHPFYKPDIAKKFGYVMPDLYKQHDRVLGELLKRLPQDVKVIVMSDHGFAPFRRNVNLNTWLAKEGYLKLEGNDLSAETSIMSFAKWSESRAYAVGLNGIYLNAKGREGEGIVKKEERRKLMLEIQQKLEALADPKTGERVVNRAFISEDHFSKNFLDRAPDIIVGFNRGYRSSGDSALGTLNPEVVYDNMDWWAGDHCMSPSLVPASFISNFKINKKVPDIRDLAPTILKHFRIPVPAAMSGKSLI